MRTKLFAFVVFFLWVVPAFAQYADTAWVRRYNGPGDSTDYANAIAVDNSGNVYVTGTSAGSGTYHDLATIKYSPNGDTSWVRRYDGSGNGGDGATAIAIDGSNNVYVTGYVWAGDLEAYEDYCTIKYYPNGDTAWIKTYNGPVDSTDQACAIAVDNSGNVYVTGLSYGSGTYIDYATIKYYPNGDTAWVRRYDGPGDSIDVANAIAVDGSGNVYVTGWSFGSGTTYEYATIKYYSYGDTAWVRRYHGPGIYHNLALALAVDGSGNIYVTGYSSGSGTADDYATIKYYPNGDTAWVRRYNGPGNSNDHAKDIAIDGSGDVYVTGYSWGDETQNDFATVKYDSTGNEVWVKRYNGIRDWYDAAYAIAVDGSGNIYVTGDDSYEGGTYDDYATIKYKPNGDTVWVRKYNGPGSSTDIPSDIVVDASGNVYVTGSSVGSGTGDDYATIKYIQYDSIPFAPAVNYGAESYSFSVFCADLDGDGDLDLATTNWGTNDVSILKNNGDGTFQSAVNYGTGDGPYCVFCADLDGDGDLDLTVANAGSNNISILKNNGDGSFQSAVNYGVEDEPHSAFCADLDGDGDLDLAVANFYGNNVSILKNNGDGTFQSAVNYGSGETVEDVFCADLDGDGDLDLAVANAGSSNVSILKNNGDGSFQSAVNYGVGDLPRSIFCSDLDGDGDLDLATANWGTNDVSILKNNGDGTFQSAVNYEVVDRTFSLFCADLDGDSDLELAVACVDGFVSVLKNNGDGIFQSAVNYGAGSFSFSVFCADLDGDTDLDLAVANNGNDNISVLENLTQVSANQAPWAFSLISPPEGDSTLAFDSLIFRWQTPYDPNFGDHIRYDLYVSTVPSFHPDSTVILDSLPLSRFTDTLGEGTYYWKVKAYDNWGAETWSSEMWSFTSYADSIPFAPAVNYGAGDGPASVFCADLDGDGDLDLAVANNNSNDVSVLKNNGDGTFWSAVNYGAGDSPWSVFCADLDGDGDLDLAIIGSSVVSILKNNGDGTFQLKVDYFGYWCCSIFCADIDGDGDLDIGILGDETVSILKNNGDGVFQPNVYRGGQNFFPWPWPGALFCADLDGDLDLDFAVANSSVDSVYILKNNGDGTFQTKVDYPTGDSPYSVFCADLDGDSDIDLVVPNCTSRNVSILKNNGNGTFSPRDDYPTYGVCPEGVFCADLDGDGYLDLAVINVGSDSILILKNNGDGTFQPETLLLTGNGPKSVFSADLDGDGDFDLAVANMYSGNVSIMKNLTQLPANQPPWDFSLISPTDQDTTFGSTTFKWHIPYDPNFGDQMRYDLYISTSLGFEPLYTTVYSNLYISKSTEVLDTGTYYWKVKAKDNWGAEAWSSQTWSFESKFLSDTMIIIAYSTTANSPVDMIVTDPMGDSISPWFNTIINATYDTLHDGNNDSYIDDIVTIPDRLVGNYQIRVVADSGLSGPYDLGIRIDGSNMLLLLTNQPSPPPGEVDTVTQYVPWYTPGDANGDWVVDVGDVVYTINYLYRSGPDPYMLQAGDVNCDGIVAVGDVVFLINYLFRNGPPPCSYKL